MVRDVSDTEAFDPQPPRCELGASRLIRHICARIWAFEGKEALSKSLALLYFTAVLLGPAD
jgi:hypothetical protein